jgi:peptidoglycan-associated lipoprotein
VALGLAALTLAGCHNYVKRDEFDSTVAELRGNIETARAENREQIAALGRDLEGKLKNQEVAINDLQDKLILNMTAHFDFDKADLRAKDEKALDDVASVVNKRPDMKVTVEGYADSAGSAAYNKRLGQRRAEAVREHLVASGLPADKVTAVSYGDDKDKQLAPGAWGERGQANRRVALVIENGSNQLGAAETHQHGQMSATGR